MLATVPANAKGNPCLSQNIPLNFRIEPRFQIAPQFESEPPTFIDTRITSDNGSTYVHGIDGVSAVIHICSGSYDAILQTTTSVRKIGVDFSNQVSATPYSPKNWTTFVGNVGINVRSLLYTYSEFSDYTFSTRMGVDFTGPDKVAYRFRIQNPSTNAFVGLEPMSNTPQLEALVMVHHIPANGADPERWEVYPDPASGIGTLLPTIKGKLQNGGQYSLPFKIVITRK